MTTKGEMIRAVFEGLGYQFLEILRAVEGGLGITAEQIVAVGGATRNTFWMQNKADMCGLPVEVPQIEEATPLGAAMLAGIGVGIYTDERDAFESVSKPGTVYEPDGNLTEAYAERFEVYRQVYPALKDISASLADLTAS